jgi:shikimate O-hydroxycinnamoyltransferase
MAMAKLRSTLLVSKRLHSGVKAPPEVLSGSDIFSGHVGIPVVLVYPQGMDLARAEASLVETLRHYPIVAGRMKKGADGHAFVDINDAGIDFRVHACAGPLPAVGPDSGFGDTIKRYFKPFMPWQLVGKDMPLLQVDLYRFDGGGVILCCYGPHSLFDGTSYWQFMKDWSALCRGEAIQAPSFDRHSVITAAQGRAVPSEAGLLYDPSMRSRIGLFARLGWRALTSLKKDVIRIPVSTIQQWKDEAKRVLPADAGVSTVELVGAWCMQQLSPLMPSAHERSVGIVLDLRHKRRLRIPRDLFGNALGYGEARYSREELASEPLPVLARRCRPTSEQVATDSLLDFLALLEAYRQRKAIWRLFWRPAGETLEAGLILNNCVNFPIYDIDFGQGGPAWYDICAVAFRMLMVVPTPEQDGSVDLHLTARPKELARLKQLMDGAAAAQPVGLPRAPETAPASA